MSCVSHGVGGDRERCVSGAGKAHVCAAAAARGGPRSTRRARRRRGHGGSEWALCRKPWVEDRKRSCRRARVVHTLLHAWPQLAHRQRLGLAVKGQGSGLGRVLDSELRKVLEPPAMLDALPSFRTCCWPWSLSRIRPPAGARAQGRASAWWGRCRRSCSLVAARLHEAESALAALTDRMNLTSRKAELEGQADEIATSSPSTPSPSYQPCVPRLFCVSVNPCSAVLRNHRMATRGLGCTPRPGKLYAHAELRLDNPLIGRSVVPPQSSSCPSDRRSSFK